MKTATEPKTGPNQENEVKVILVDDSKEDSGIGSASNASTNSSMNEENGAGTIQNIEKNIIIEFQALNCKPDKQRESTFVVNAGQMPAADLSSIRGSANVTVLSEGTSYKFLSK